MEIDSVVLATLLHDICKADMYKRSVKKRNYDSARMLYPLVTIVQVADSIAAGIMERTGGETDDL